MAVLDQMETEAQNPEATEVQVFYYWIKIDDDGAETYVGKTNSMDFAFSTAEALATRGRPVPATIAVCRSDTHAEIARFPARG